MAFAEQMNKWEEATADRLGRHTITAKGKNEGCTVFP